MLNTTLIPDDWTPKLASAIAGALREFVPRLGSEPLAMLAVDCHPWHGGLGLAALTGIEVATQSFLADPAEMAAWRYFDFARDMPSWKATSELGNQMKSAYHVGDCTAIADAFLHACATAITSNVVCEALAPLVRTNTFRLSVAHPDDGREFV